MKQKPKEKGEWKEEKGISYQWQIEQDADGGMLLLTQLRFQGSTGHRLVGMEI